MKRRDFLRKSIYSAIGGVGLYSAMGNLKLVEAAIRAYGPKAFTDYKAMVCVFMFGGNDSLNMVVPRSGTQYTQYASARATLALPQSALLPLTPVAGGAPSDGGSYGLQASTNPDDSVGTSGLQGLFNSGKAAILSNVGTLVRPVTKAEVLAGNVPLPPQLFSHNDQQNYWQTSRSDDTRNLGWGGRIADLLFDANPGATIPMAVSLGSESNLARAADTNQYVLGTDGPRYYGHLEYDDERRAAALALMQENTLNHALERGFASTFNRSRANSAALGAALDGAPPLTTQFPGSYLAAQLRMVARLIAVRANLNLKRQIFFVSIGGFDNHSGLLTDQPLLLAEISQALSAFYAATQELGVADSVTAFTASDFGRTLSSNGDGSDHGWGAHHFAVGGGVQGGKFYGTMPKLQNDGPDDLGGGQIVPTTSVDQYAATLARWFGVGDAELDLIFPNLGNYPTRNLGFMG
ncbi:MAG: DUF1501 domain-containing protein [Luteimonas sp.]